MHRRIPALDTHTVQVGQGRHDRHRGLVTALYHESTVVRLPLHLISNHLRDGITRLERVRHADMALCSAVAHYRHREVEGHSTVLPDAHGSPQERVPVLDMRRVVTRPAYDGDARCVCVQALEHGFEGAAGLCAMKLVGTVQQRGHGDRLVSLALYVI